TPRDVTQLFIDDKLDVKHTITAEDIMNKEFPTVANTTCVKEVIDIFTSTGKNQVAVVDENKCLIGSVSIESILKSGIPEYILMMDNLKFLPNLEPFENLLANEESMHLSQFMQRNCDIIAPKTPLIQVIVKLVKREATHYYVVDDNRIPLGVITYQELVKNILRG
ncbi:MAG: CBS domain-containing protein, partial [Lentisphaeria bacterium]